MEQCVCTRSASMGKSWQDRRDIGSGVESRLSIRKRWSNTLVCSRETPRPRIGSSWTSCRSARPIVVIGLPSSRPRCSEPRGFSSNRSQGSATSSPRETSRILRMSRVYVAPMKQYSPIRMSSRWFIGSWSIASGRSGRRPLDRSLSAPIIRW